MSDISRKYRRHDAVLWRNKGRDPYGTAILDQPVQIKVRWEWRQLQTVDGRGNLVALQATVTVPLEIPIGSVLWHGRLDDLDRTQSNKFMQVKTYDETLALKGQHLNREVGLTYFKGEIPEPA